MVPAGMEKELEAQVHLFRTYEDLKGHALDLAARSQGNSGEAHHLEETLSTLRFATRMKQVENVPHVNETAD